MADQDSHPSRAEQRMLAVARLKRAASLPRMKDGRRPPMHVEFVSEGEKVGSEEEKGASEEDNPKTEKDETTPEPEQLPEDEKDPSEGGSPPPPPPPIPAKKVADIELDGDTELEPEDRPTSPNAVAKKRRSRSRSRSRSSRDFKVKARGNQSPIPQLAGDSSQDENQPMPPPIMLPMLPTVVSPIPSPFPFLQQSRFLRSPTPVSPEMALFYPVTSPPTPLPTLEDLQKGLMRSNSAGNSAAGRRMAMHKLTGGTETYDPSPPPTPPPIPGKLGRNNTVSGGERIAARQNMLSRLGTRITKEADAELASGAEDRGAPSPTPKKRRRRSKRTSATVAANPTISDSDFNSDPNTPAIPITHLPTLQDHYAQLRAMSITPNQLSSSRNPSSERVVEATPSPPPPLPLVDPIEEEPEHHEHARRRSILIEDPDDEDRCSPHQHYAALPGTPQRSYSRMEGLRGLHSSNAPSNGSSDSAPGSVGVPIFLSQRAPSRNEPFPSSPFTTPLKEKALSDNEEEEQVLYPPSTVRPRTPYGNVMEHFDREISWVASPVPEIRMPIHDDNDDDGDDYEDDDDQGDQSGVLTQHIEELEVVVHDEVEEEEEEEEEVPLSTGSSADLSPEAFDDTSPRVSTSSKSVLVESETSPENGHSYVPPSPSSAAAISHAAHFSDGSGSPQSFPARLSIASRIQYAGDRSPLTGDFSDWDDRYVPSESPKRTENSPSAWEKVKNIVRAGSSTGRRSRTNSILARERRDHTDSSVSRESAASLTSAKTDKGDSVSPLVQPQAPPLMQSPSASASILSLAPHAPPRSSISPIPPASSADMSKYQNAKLFPFPGIVRLEEERRLKGLPGSSPDVTFRSNADDAQASPLSYTFSNAPMQSPDTHERRLSPQNSESGLASNGEPTSSPYSPNSPDYFDVSPSAPNGYLKLPTTLPGVKQWLSKNSRKKNSGQPSTPSPGPSITFSPPAAMDTSTITNKKPSLSDIFGKKGNELTAWEDVPMPNADDAAGGKQLPRPTNGASVNGPNHEEANHFESNSTPKISGLASLDLNKESTDKSSEGLPSTRLATPDPSSLSDYPAPTASESSSTNSSQYSFGRPGSQGLVLLDHLEENLGCWNYDPPRKLILSSPVLQVVDPNTVKDRFLFLFNDILVIAKPVNRDPENLLDTYKVSLPDRKYVVKSVALLRNIRFSADRSETKITNNPLNPRNHHLRTFVGQFTEDPDQAIGSLFSKTSTSSNSVLLGQVLFRTLDLDRERLGDYLARRTSKTILKAYLDSFGFGGFRVDLALRIFLHSIHISRHAQSLGSLDLLLEAFSSRWYEANAKFVAYDKDMAKYLIRSLVQLNGILHGPIADEPGPTDHNKQNVTSKAFQDAFRRYDARYLVSDEQLAELYRSIFHEQLCQALSPMSGIVETPITIKRALPARLTYKTQSEPIVFRLPQPDPMFSIKLFGQDLIFEPTVLHFSKSSEASFRVMGTSLGSKTMIMCRCGPNAIQYSGLPQSHTIAVERAFMRNTFQLAFLDKKGGKRRYMFSVDDPIIRNEWATSLRRHIDAATLAAASGSNIASSSPGVAKLHKAADSVAFKVLQSTLIGSSDRKFLSNTHRANGSQLGNMFQLTGSSLPFTGPLHIRSKSRSKVYHRHGAGMNELDLGHRSENSSRESNDVFSGQNERHDQSPVSDSIHWTSRDLEMHCQQNSAISHILSSLHVGVQEPAS